MVTGLKASRFFTEWLITGTVQKLVVAVTGQESKATLERWVFDIHTDLPKEGESPRIKGEKETGAEIQAIIRQICASVTFLPLLDAHSTFDILLYTDTEVPVPLTWEETDPKYIKNAESVRLRSFDTKVPYQAPYVFV